MINSRNHSDRYKQFPKLLICPLIQTIEDQSGKAQSPAVIVVALMGHIAIQGRSILGMSGQISDKVRFEMQHLGRCPRCDPHVAQPRDLPFQSCIRVDLLDTAFT
jgi:hypothetical protein